MYLSESIAEVQSPLSVYLQSLQFSFRSTLSNALIAQARLNASLFHISIVSV